MEIPVFVKKLSLAFLLAAAFAPPTRGEAAIPPRTIELGVSGTYASTSSGGFDRRILKSIYGQQILG